MKVWPSWRAVGLVSLALFVGGFVGYQLGVHSMSEALREDRGDDPPPPAGPPTKLEITRDGVGQPIARVTVMRLKVSEWEGHFLETDRRSEETRLRQDKDPEKDARSFLLVTFPRSGAAQQKLYLSDVRIEINKVSRTAVEWLNQLGDFDELTIDFPIRNNPADFTYAQIELKVHFEHARRVSTGRGPVGHIEYIPSRPAYSLFTYDKN